MDRESLRVLLAQGLSLDQIGRRFGKDASTIGYWVKKHELQAANKDKHASRGGLDRAAVEELLASGLSLEAIAGEVGVSTTTVKYWLRKWGLHTRRAQQRSLARAAKAGGQTTVELECVHHGRTEFWLEGRGAYRCSRCRGEAVSRRRRRVKQILVAEAGGRCQICGYDRSPVALHFHHLDPAGKTFGLASLGSSRGIAAMREEASKCALLCANCHAEVEAGIVKLPLVSRLSGAVYSDPG